MICTFFFSQASKLGNKFPLAQMELSTLVARARVIDRAKPARAWLVSPPPLARSVRRRRTTARAAEIAKSGRNQLVGTTCCSAGRPARSFARSLARLLALWLAPVPRRQRVVIFHSAGQPVGRLSGKLADRLADNGKAACCWAGREQIKVCCA